MWNYSFLFVDPKRSRDWRATLNLKKSWIYGKYAQVPDGIIWWFSRMMTLCPRPLKCLSAYSTYPPDSFSLFDVQGQHLQYESLSFGLALSPRVSPILPPSWAIFSTEPRMQMKRARTPTVFNLISHIAAWLILFLKSHLIVYLGTRIQTRMVSSHRSGLIGPVVQLHLPWPELSPQYFLFCVCVTRIGCTITTSHTIGLYSYT